MILLKDCFYILADEKRGLEGHDILIKGNRIERVGRSIDLKNFGDEKVETINCSSFVCVPGLVNTHHHFYQTLTRNLPGVQNAKLFDWLRYLYGIWKGIDEEAVFYSTLVACAELLKTGCSCTTDHHYLYPAGFSADLMGIQFEAAEKLGIRFSPCRGSMSLSVKDGGLPPDSVVQTEDEILSDSQRVIERYHDSSEFGMRRVILAPCSPFSVTRTLMIETARLGREHGVRLHTHLSETRDEEKYCLQHYGKRPLELMQELGFIGEDTSYAHGIFFNDEELKIIAETKTSIAHCPTSNMRLGSGVARVREMLNLGINVGLGVDGSASNDTSDFLGEMRQALLLQRVKYGPDALTAGDVYRMATQNGARLLGFDRIGKIREGYAADLALFNINRVEYAGSISDPAASLIFCGINHTAEYTIVNGKIAVRNGSLTAYDEEEIIKNANRIAEKLLKGLGTVYFF